MKFDLFTLFLLFCLFVYTYPPGADAQYRNYTSQYQLKKKTQTKLLIGQLQSHPDLIYEYFPDKQFINNDFYVYDYPIASKYRIGVLVDPCRYNNYNCCMNVFGTPEYPALLQPGLEQERVYKYRVLASDTEVSKNYFLVYEDGSSISYSAQRTADDYELFNSTCLGMNNPEKYCQGRNDQYLRAPVRPPCMDNNYSLNALEGCQDPETGEYKESCVQVAYYTNTFIPQCNENERYASDHCGTYLEVHMPMGTVYYSEDTVLSSVKIEQNRTSGYSSVVLPLTFMGNDSKILCSFSESKFRIGSLVYIKPSAPVCCCPPPYSKDTRVGSFQCPTGAVANGAFAYRDKSLADTLITDSLLLNYPFCPIDLSYNEDRMMCSAYDVKNRRAYARPCEKVRKTDPRRDRSWTSIDMVDQYDGECEYYESCALTLDSGKCRLGDLKFTFVGYVGIVTGIDNKATIPKVMVSFNGNRTSYQFNQEHVELQTTGKSMYELWWVVRSKSWYTVQKKKAFNITWPPCTFDTTNDRYFPFAMLNTTTGEPFDNSLFA